MKVIDIVQSLLPRGTDGSAFAGGGSKKIPVNINVDRCPIWPPDLFAVTGTLIERSSCYTQAGPGSKDLQAHRKFLLDIEDVAKTWAGSENGLFYTPQRVDELWDIVVRKHAETDVGEIINQPELCDALLLLFAMSDEASKGMGWDSRIGASIFSDLALYSFVVDANDYSDIPRLPYAPNSLCALVPPNAAIVMPKTLTAAVGCTLRSLSHHLALLPSISQCRPEWALTNEAERSGKYKPLQLLVIPFPYNIPSHSFTLASDPKHLAEGTFTSAYFKLEQLWLHTDKKNGPISAEMLFIELIQPLLQKAIAADKQAVTGIIMPECALSEPIADKLANLLSGSNVSFFTTGILSTDPASKKMRNLAKTYVLHGLRPPIPLAQYKHHRWRLDQRQCEQYGLDFHRLSAAEKWWEDIDVSNRKLPFFALRKDMSMTVLICEDLARNDPAMSVVRAIGPNLVVALLMDGPQLSTRWPGRYATVLGDDPGSGVLSVSCAAMVDRANASWSGVSKRIVGLWRGDEETNTEIALPEGSHAVLLNINYRLVMQQTMDNRSDSFCSKKMKLGRVTPLQLNSVPQWL